MKKGMKFINGRRFFPVPFLINTKRDGVMSNLTMIPDDHAVELSGGEEFTILYVPEEMLKGEEPTDD